MSSYTKAIILFALALSTTALTTPHARNNVHHRSLVARVAAPLPVADITPVTPTRRKRSLAKRCLHNTGNGTETSPSTSVSSSASVNATSDPAATPDVKSNTTVLATTSSTSGSSDFMAGVQTGDGTFYGTGLGSCGFTNQDTDDICAVSELLYDVYPGYNGADPNSNPVCGRYIKASYQGNSVVVKVVDRCVGCSKTSLDFSPGAFDKLANPSVGRIHDMTWEWA
jgi:expansin (peptidoglycan-binding protein)